MTKPLLLFVITYLLLLCFWNFLLLPTFNIRFKITANRRTFYDFKTDSIPGVPDGMTIDESGNLWIANYDGAQVLKPTNFRVYFLYY